MIFINQKIKIIFKDEEDRLKLERQMALCNRLYNKVMEEMLVSRDKELLYVRGDYLTKRVKEIISEDDTYDKVNKDPLLEVAKRIKNGFVRFYQGLGNKPHFRANEKKRYSLLYGPKTSKIKLEKNHLYIPFGNTVDENGEVHEEGIRVKLNSQVLKNRGIYGYRIIEHMGNYYVLINMAKLPTHLAKTCKMVAIDQNHQNFFMAADSDGKTFEFENLFMVKYFDKQQEAIMRKRGKCDSNPIIKYTKNNIPYTAHSRRYTLLTNKLRKVLNKRSEQAKQAMYVIAKFLTEKYDVIAIGNYEPRVELSNSHTMSRAMLYNSEIGKFRKILEYVCERTGKRYLLVDEKNTTATCFNCNEYVEKDPTIRSFECPCCHKTYNRDINSAINIGIKAKVLTKEIFNESDLTKPNKVYYYNYKLTKIFAKTKNKKEE